MRRKRYQQPGSPPGTLTPLAEAYMPKSIHVIHYTTEAFEEADVASAADLARYKEAEGVTWVNVDGLGNTEMIRELGQFFGFHPLALEDVLNVPQRPKVDDYESHLFVVTRMLHFFETGIETEQVGLFLGERIVVTFQERPGDCLDPVRDRLRKRTGRLCKQGADYLMYAIIDAIVDGYFPTLERVGEIVEVLEDEVVDNPSRQILSQVHDLKHKLLDMRRCVWPARDAINALVRDDSGLVSEPTRVYLRDCYDHAVQVLDIIETYRELAGGLMDVYLSSLSNKMNEVMKVLTIIATIFIPLTFVTGLYGMNFDPEYSPWNMPELRWFFGYPAALAVMATVAVVMILYFRRKRWL